MTQGTDRLPVLSRAHEGRRWRLPSKYIPLLATAAVVVTLYVWGGLQYRNFFSLRVLVDLLKDNAFLGVAAVGATFVILSGGIDLSVGAVVAFTGIFIADRVHRGTHPIVAMGMALVLGAVFGVLQGCIIHFYKQPAFLVTLAGMFFARGMGFVIQPQAMGIKHPFYVTTVVDTLAVPITATVSLPFIVFCFAAVFVVALFIAHNTRFGRAVYAIGDDEQSATLMGLSVGRTKITVYTLAGFVSAMAGAVYTMYTQSGDPAACVGFELDAIASVVIGGTLLSGGVGFVGGTAMGVLILGLIQTHINFNGRLNTWWTRIAVGALVLLFIAIQNLVAMLSRQGSRAK